MKAIVYEEYGPPEDVLELKEVEKPTPKDNEVLVKVYATSVNYADWSFVRGQPFLVRLIGAGLLKPKHPILGADIRRHQWWNPDDPTDFHFSILGPFSEDLQKYK